MDTVSSQSDELTLDLPSAHSAAAQPPEIPSALLHDLWHTAEAASVGLTESELAAILNSLGARHNFGLPEGTQATQAHIEKFCLALHLCDLALARACALGRDEAWQQFLHCYRSPLRLAAISLTGSSSLGEDLADALYPELFGLTERGGQRHSPLASYSGRGSLMGWLRAILAQRHVDYHRRTRRESPLDDNEPAAPDAASGASPEVLYRVSAAITETLHTLAPDDRFLLSTYYLDQKTLLQIAQLLRVHEATISRRLKRLTARIYKHLLKHLQASGLSRRAAEDALGTDPRDITINLRYLLQPPSPLPFLHQTGTSDPKQS